MKSVKKVFGLLLALALLVNLQVLDGQAQNPQDSDQQDSAQSESAEQDSSYVAQTAGDVKIPTDQLQIQIRPLTRGELEVEADAWFKLLRDKCTEIASTQLGVKSTTAEAEADAEAEAEAEAEIEAETAGEDGTPGGAEPTDSGQQSSSQADTTSEASQTVRDELLERVNLLQDERTAIIDRLNLVLGSLELKGGDVKEYQDYIAAVSGIQLDTTDVSATWAAIRGWLLSDEGGKRWLWNFVKFFLLMGVAWIIAKIVERAVNWLLEQKLHLTKLLEHLISRTVKNIVLLIGLAIALTALEVDVTPILAAIGATGFIVGFALQGTLSNFASGLMILVNRPFDVGDVVTAGGVTGNVHAMNLVSTTFRTFDNQTIHVPNNNIWGSVITNITANDTRRVDMEFGIGYDDDFEKAEEIMREIVQSHELVLDEPEPVIVTHLLADSSVNIVCRPWAKTSDWWTVKTDVTRQVKKRFDEAGISIPYPQRDIHVYQHSGEPS